MDDATGGMDGTKRNGVRGRCWGIAAICGNGTTRKEGKEEGKKFVRQGNKG